MAQIDLNRFPYNQIEDRTIGNNEMVFIPKMYVKNETVTEESTNCKLIKRYISNVKKTGFHCHPAFMTSGHETDTGILISKYVAKGTQVAPASTESGEVVKLALADAQTAASSLGADWHMYNIYEHHLLALLMLIEYGSTDLQNLIGGSATANGVTHYGITDIWGAVSSYNIWINGIDTLGDNNGAGTANTTLRVLDNLGNGTMVDTGLVCNTDVKSGWIIDLQDASGEGYDLNDLFIAKTASNTESGGSFGDYQSLGHGGCAFSAYSGSDSNCGAFYLDNDLASSQSAFRLAKYV